MVCINQREFINWTVEGKRKVVIIPKIGEVIRGTALACHDDTLQVVVGDVIQEIPIELIGDIFGVQK